MCSVLKLKERFEDFNSSIVDLKKSKSNNPKVANPYKRSNDYYVDDPFWNEIVNDCMDLNKKIKEESKPKPVEEAPYHFLAA